MNTTIQTEAHSAAAETGEAAIARKSRKRRMVRRPKAPAAVALSPDNNKSHSDLQKPSEPHGPSKIAAVIALLQRSGGATLAEMVEATGWLPHTTRAALTGLKKKGHAVTKGKRSDVTCYSITSHAA